MSKITELRFRNLVSEGFLRELVLFFFLFLLTIAQYWDSILLFIFPLISFGFYVFFRLLSINKWKIAFSKDEIIYNPLGVEKRHANRFYFVALFNLILIFWIGAESLYHPQLIEDYSNYFLTLLIFMYTFGFTWIFIDIWKYSKIQIKLGKIIENNEELNTHLNSTVNSEKNSIISSVNFKIFKQIIIMNWIIFVSINILNLISNMLLEHQILIGFNINLPGTRTLNQNGILVSFLIFFIILIPPISCLISFFLLYNNIMKISLEKFKILLDALPNDKQLKIKQELLSLNDKFKLISRIE
ncbi:MAG: hypothetical protein ACTSUN_06855 [Promethearchaeota archaeon]